LIIILLSRIYKMTDNKSLIQYLQENNYGITETNWEDHKKSLIQHLQDNNMEYKINNDGIMKINWEDYKKLIDISSLYTSEEDSLGDVEYMKPNITIDMDSFKFLVFPN
ncbi:Hypothetical protein ORPV_817, partial [Orpheovirus IHUMI-LCC2]